VRTACGCSTAGGCRHAADSTCYTALWHDQCAGRLRNAAVRHCICFDLEHCPGMPGVAAAGGTISPGGSRPVSRTLERHTSVTERFQRAAAAADLVADPAASVTASKDSAAAAAEQRRLSSGSVTSAVEQVQEAGPTSQPAAPPPPAAAAAKRRSSGGASVGGEASSEQQLIKAHYAAAAEAGIDAQPSLDQVRGCTSGLTGFVVYMLHT
jgi:hypothetical protein